MERMTMTVEEVGKAMGISRPKAYELTERADFPVILIGRRKVVPVDAFRRWMDAQTEQATPALSGSPRRA